MKIIHRHRVLTYWVASPVPAVGVLVAFGLGVVA